MLPHGKAWHADMAKELPKIFLENESDPQQKKLIFETWIIADCFGCSNQFNYIACD